MREKRFKKRSQSTINSDAVRNLARMKLMDNDFSGVKELLLKLGPDPHDMEALMMLAYAQWQTREFDAAQASALKSTKVILTASRWRI